MRLQMVRVVVSLLSIIVCRIFAADWNYADRGPDVWSDEYPSCAGRSQSPINILTTCTIYQQCSPFKFSFAYDTEQNFTLENNGHTIVGTFVTDNPSPLYRLNGGGLNGEFEFVNFHLHWGKNYNSGSEHQVNGKKYAGEAHFVHVNPSTKQTAVLSFFMEVHPDTCDLNTRLRALCFRQGESKHRKRNIILDDDSTSEEWKRYFNIAQTLQEHGNKSVMKLNLASLTNIDMNHFWRYQGSLTTPPCTEGIIWTIFKEPIEFTESELSSFRKNIFFESYRGPQRIYDRVVYRNFLYDTLPTNSEYQCCSRNLNDYSTTATTKAADHRQTSRAIRHFATDSMLLLVILFSAFYFQFS